MSYYRHIKHMRPEMNETIRCPRCGKIVDRPAFQAHLNDASECHTVTLGENRLRWGR